MVSIVSDNQDIERSIEKLLGQIKAAGGFVEDQLTLKCANGYFGIEAPPEIKDKIIVKLPRRCLAPTDTIQVKIEGDDIVIASHDPDVQPETLGIMETMLELFNRTGKIKEHRKTSSYLFLLSHLDLVETLIKGRSERYLRDIRDITPEKEETFVLDTFLKTRSLQYKTNENAEFSLVFMPVIDFMDHHFCGAPFLTQEQRDGCLVAVRRSPPLDEHDRQCRAYYGPNDAFDSWLNYNYVDMDVPFVRSVTMDIELPDMGTFHINAHAKPALLSNLPDHAKDLKNYLPNITARREKYSEASFLIIPGPNAPRALRRVLHVLLAEMQYDHPRLNALVKEAEEQVIARNIAYYQDLRKTVSSLKLNRPDMTFVTDGLLLVCSQQLAKLENYKTFAMAAAA